MHTTMLIECPDCARPYNVSRDDLGERGRVVICPRCSARWYVSGSELTAAPTFDIPADAIGDRSARSRHAPTPGDFPLFRRLRPAFVSCLLLASAIGAVEARVPIVRAVPRMAALYAAAGLPVNVRGLEIGHLAPVRLRAAEVMIAGEIRNVAQRRLLLPRVAFEIRDATGSSLVSWSEGVPAKMLAPGKTLAFTSAPHDLPPDGRTVLVRFESDDAPAAAPDAR